MIIVLHGKRLRSMENPSRDAHLKQSRAANRQIERERVLNMGRDRASINIRIDKVAVRVACSSSIDQPQACASVSEIARCRTQ